MIVRLLCLPNRLVIAIIIIITIFTIIVITNIIIEAIYRMLITVIWFHYIITKWHI